MIDDIRKDAEMRMGKSLESLQGEMKKIRTGRANTSLVEDLMVSYYGTDTPLNQLATISVEDARTLSVNPWDKGAVESIEKAIMSADMGLNPTTAGTVIRIPMPPLTEERRKDLIKVARSEAEAARVAIRNIRRDANNHIKELLKEKEISQDDERRGEDIIQKLTDRHITEVDKILDAKEKDLMEI
jgi:ribosome recycling factor